MKQLHLFRGHVYHSRSETAENSFRYPILNICFPVARQEELKTLLTEKFSWFGFKPETYLENNSQNLEKAVADLVLERFGYSCKNAVLQTIPSMFGFVFNPVNFWYFFDSDYKILEAVLCEVNNTFGERHFYWLFEKGADLNGQWLISKKEFHVSPFFDLSGHYKFKFIIKDLRLESHIQYINSDHSLRLVTWIKGELSELSHFSQFNLLLRYGWMTPLVLLRIHYQAAKLYVKKVKFFSKPQTPEKEVTYGSRFTGR